MICDGILGSETEAPVVSDKKKRTSSNNLVSLTYMNFSVLSFVWFVRKRWKVGKGELDKKDRIMVFFLFSFEFYEK